MMNRASTIQNYDSLLSNDGYIDLKECAMCGKEYEKSSYEPYCGKKHWKADQL